MGFVRVAGPLVPTVLPGNGFGRRGKYGMHPIAFLLGIGRDRTRWRCSQSELQGCPWWAMLAAVTTLPVILWSLQPLVSWPAIAKDLDL
ncbi:MAG: hypothetical protein GDA43_01380 [Hormoscilla sp. SP5CHS1]|nr:hypothetical protein [Hormoscilla sp. SP12CHS1]MBC6452005.1 hypothetical protein [Hormoscilla sp. SP5CHS1]